MSADDPREDPHDIDFDFDGLRDHAFELAEKLQNDVFVHHSRACCVYTLAVLIAHAARDDDQVLGVLKDMVEVELKMFKQVDDEKVTIDTIGETKGSA